MPNQPFICPNCGADVPARAKSCPECGSDEKTGWSKDTIYDGTGIEDPDEFDYEEWKESEGVTKKRRSGWGLVVWIVAIVMLALSVFLLLR
jgi:hypothetical protein